MSVENILGSNNKIIAEYLPVNPNPDVQSITSGNGIYLGGSSAYPVIENKGAVRIRTRGGLGQSDVTATTQTITNFGVLNLTGGTNITIGGTSSEPEIIEANDPVQFPEPIVYNAVVNGIDQQSGAPCPSNIPPNTLTGITSIYFPLLKDSKGIPYSNCKAVRIIIGGDQPAQDPYSAGLYLPSSMYSGFKFNFPNLTQNIYNSHTYWWLYNTLAPDFTPLPQPQYISYLWDDGNIIYNYTPLTEALPQTPITGIRIMSPGPATDIPFSFNGGQDDPPFYGINGIHTTIVYPQLQPWVHLAINWVNNISSSGVVDFSQSYTNIKFWLTPLY